MLKRFTINFALFSMLLDAFVVAFSLNFATDFRPMLNSLESVEPLYAPIYTPPILYLIFPLIWSVIFSSFSLYDGKKYLRVVDEFAALTLASLIASVSAAGILYLSLRQLSRALFLFFITTTYLLFLAWRVIVRLYFRIKKDRLEPQKRVLIVGAGSLGQKVAEQIQATDLEAFALIGFVDNATYPDVLGSYEDIQKILLAHQITDVIVALPHSAYQQLGEIIQALDEKPIRVWIALGFFDLALYRTRIDDLAGIPMLDLRASAIDDYQRLMKRGFDLVLGSILLLLSLPIMAMIALLLVLDDGFPVIFRQKRVGENGEIFEMLKFRTMVKNADQLQSQVATRDEDGNLIHKTEDDPRIRRMGRILRRLSLDELPQFINVVRGDMSLVGPRPEMPYLVDKYQPWQRKRFAVPPGLTGWWQINGRSDRPMHLNTEDDLYYISNYSLWLDIQIIVRTAWIVLIGRGAY
jgi:exopolysaccharide biosynthesis polyprenyl glycosylphosphotransferase